MTDQAKTGTTGESSPVSPARGTHDARVYGLTTRGEDHPAFVAQERDARDVFAAMLETHGVDAMSALMDAIGRTSAPRVDAATLGELAEIAELQAQLQERARAKFDALTTALEGTEAELEDVTAQMDALRERARELRDRRADLKSALRTAKSQAGERGTGTPRTPKGTEHVPVPEAHTYGKTGDTKTEAAFRKGYAAGLKGANADDCPMQHAKRKAAWDAGRNAGMNAAALAKADAR